VAEAAHVSRSALYRLFSGSGGVSRYIQRARLDLAWTSLSDPAHPRRVSEVAFGCGFSSEAHFCRAFRRAFGVTPGQVNGRGAGHS
jgi:AraC-like DNA-binding protein